MYEPHGDPNGGIGFDTNVVVGDELSEFVIGNEAGTQHNIQKLRRRTRKLTLLNGRRRRKHRGGRH